MKATILTLIMWSLIILQAGDPLFAWGEFDPNNLGAPTRLYSADGPFAGPDILGLYFAGPTENELAPIGVPTAHSAGPGYVKGSKYTVPTVECGDYAMVQLAAWDGILWGPVDETVPSDQIGRTDIVPVWMSCGTLPLESPVFTQPAIVPIPEPSQVLLGVVGIAVLGWWRRWIRANLGSGCNYKS